MQRPIQLRSLFSWFKKTDSKPSNYSFSILGCDSQLLELNLLPYQSVRIDPSSLIYHEPGITLDTKMMTPSSTGLQRAATGSSLFVIDLTNENEKSAALVGLSPSHYSQILHFFIDDLETPLCFVSDSFLCSGLGVDIEAKYFGVKMALAKRNLFMQKFTGKGSVFVKAGINVKEIVLGNGDSIVVASNSLLGFEDSVEVGLSVNLHPQLVRTEDNFYMLRVSGPGKVFVQNTSKEGFELGLASSLERAGVGLGQVAGYGIFGREEQQQPEGTKVLKVPQTDDEEGGGEGKGEGEEGQGVSVNHSDQHEQGKDYPEEQVTEHSVDNSDTTFDDTIDSNSHIGGPNS